jgi:hypothetical protein
MLPPLAVLLQLAHRQKLVHPLDKMLQLVRRRSLGM